MSTPTHMPRTAKPKSADTATDPYTEPVKAKKTRKPKSDRTLTDDEVVGIRRMFHVERKKVVDICAFYGDLPQSTVYTCARGTSYKHIPMPNGTLPNPKTIVRRTKISAESVARIRAMAAETIGPMGPLKYTQAEIARAVDVSPPYVRAIILGKFRADIEPASGPTTDADTNAAV